jgi:N-acetylglucosaminyl-diphospho-decaprenol L-rhamnosyltransferase
VTVFTRVRAVVVIWNSAPTLDRCLRHLLATSWPDGVLEIVVVDNGSTDHSVDGWSARYPTIELRQTGANLGFGAGANRALADLDHLDGVALVNPDAFVEPGWLPPLIAALENDDSLGAACPKILFAQSDPAGLPIINNVGNEIDGRWEPRDRGYGELDHGQYDTTEEVWAWCGGAVLLRTDYVRSAGLFDERLFLYCEDVDLSWRGRRKGWRYQYVPQSVVRHVHRASSGGVRTPLLDYLNRRNRLVVVSRHAGPRGTAIAWSRAMGGTAIAGLRLLLAVVRREPIRDGADVSRRFRAAVDALRMLVGRPVKLPTALQPASRGEGP